MNHEPRLFTLPRRVTDKVRNGKQLRISYCDEQDNFHSYLAGTNYRSEPRETPGESLESLEREIQFQDINE